MQITVIGADDLEVVGTVLGIASSLKSLFDADHSGEILKKLNDLREQNAKIIDLLSKVISVLENMDVVLKGVTRDAFVFDLRAEISSAMVQYYETRSGLISDPTYKQRAIEQSKLNTKRSPLPESENDAIRIWRLQHGRDHDVFRD